MVLNINLPTPGIAERKEVKYSEGNRGDNVCGFPLKTDKMDKSGLLLRKEAGKTRDNDSMLGKNIWCT